MSATNFNFDGLGDGVATEAEADGGADRRIQVAPPPKPTPSAPTSTPSGALTRPQPAAAGRVRATRSGTHTNKISLRLHPDQRRLLGDLAERLDLFRTQTLAAVIDQYLGDIRKAGPLQRPPRRRRGPRPGEETVDYQIDIEPARAAKVQEVADKISNGDFSAVIRAVLDAAFTTAGFDLGPRPELSIGLGGLTSVDPL